MKVAVIMPLYNGRKHIEQALASVLTQTHTDLDVIVIDDGSTDHGADVVERIDDPRVRVLRQRNHGVAGARNTGLSATDAPLIAFLDQDDVWFPEKLEKQIPLFRDDVVAVGSLMTYLGPRGPLRATSGEMADTQNARIAAAKLMPFAPSSMILLRAGIDKVGPFDRDLVVTAGPVDDLDLVARLAGVGRVLTHPETLGYYRVHGDAGSFTRFYDMQRATRYLQARGTDFLTWQEWSAANPPTASERRADRARFLYRSAGLGIASGQYLRGGVRLAGSVLLAPRYALGRLRRQTQRH